MQILLFLHLHDNFFKLFLPVCVLLDDLEDLSLGHGDVAVLQLVAAVLVHRLGSQSLTKGIDLIVSFYDLISDWGHT